MDTEKNSKVRILLAFEVTTYWSRVHSHNRCAPEAHVGRRHLKILCSLQSCFTGFSWIQLIHLIRRMNYKTGMNTTNIYYPGTAGHATRIWSDWLGKHGACHRKHLVRYWFSYKGFHYKPGCHIVGRIWRDVSTSYVVCIEIFSRSNVNSWIRGIVMTRW